MQSQNMFKSSVNFDRDLLYREKEDSS